MGRTEAGKKAESLAIKSLKKRGYNIIARNWRCKYGEIDCAALKDGNLVIVEIKSGEGELPYEKLHQGKQQKLRLLAQMFANSFEITDLPVRFDAVIVDITNKHVVVIENAF